MNAAGNGFRLTQRQPSDAVRRRGESERTGIARVRQMRAPGNPRRMFKAINEGRRKLGMNEISAGGVVYRRVDGRIEIQLIRDRFGKITLPKGKMEPGETVEQTALREIEEETGIRGRIEAPIDRVSYRYVNKENETVDKEVHYYLVEAVGGRLKAQEEEIGGVSWHSPEEAWRLQRDMGYDNNDRVLSGAFRLLGIGVDGVG